ncbi:unnamed protein product [Alternaria alternata]
MGSIAENGVEHPSGQLIVHAIEEKARWIPNNMFMRYALEDWEQDGYKTITWKQYANAIDKMAFWFDEQLGKAVDRETVAYFGPNDPRYAILVPAIAKNGRRLLIPDGRVTNEGLAGLVALTNCKVWLYAKDDPAGPLVKSESSLKLCAVPSLDWMLDNEGQERYPYETTFEEAKWDEIVIIHTSGTTGEVTLTPALFKKITSMNKVDGMKCPPFTIAGLYEDPVTRDILKSLEFVVYIGAPLDRAIGDDLCQHTRLSPVIGSTETGDQIGLRPADRSLWYTHDFVPENGHKMVPFDTEGSDNLHELILENAEDGRTNPFQLAFWNSGHRHLKRIETKELYRPVKDSDGRTRWAFSARKDDLTKLNWLAKFHAQSIESRILQHQEVQNAVVGGEGRPAPYVIVQVKEGALDEKSEAQLLDELYDSVIVGANKNDIDEIRIPRETVMAATREKPLKVNFKQVVQRRAIEQDYLEEIEQAYLQLEGARRT